MGKIKGTEVTSPLSPQSTDTVFPTHIDTYGRGVMSVKTIAERDAIKFGELLDEDGYSSGRRKYRMPVWVADQKKWYILDIITFDTLSDAAKVTALADNANWIALADSGITFAALSITGQVMTLTTSAGSNSVTLPTPTKSVLEFPFTAGYADDISATITSGTAGTYLSQMLSNTTSVQYNRNSVTVALPFSVVAGDTLTVVIVRTTVTIGSLVSITT